jgi:hypothetical protein
MSWFIRVAKWVTPDFFKEAKTSNSIQVVTIGLSHFCEMACWALKLGNVDFQERAYSPGLHIFAALAVRVGTDKKFLSKSSRSTQGKEDKLTEENMTEEEKKKAKKRDTSARATAVPLAIKPDGSVLLDSWEIASFGLGNTIDPRLKEILDHKIGPLARQRAYAQLLLPKNRDMFDKLLCTGHGWVFRLCWRLFMGNYMMKTMMKMFSTDLEKNKNELVVAVQEIESKFLESKVGPFIQGEKISLSDVAVAALFAPLVSPPLYCEGKYNQVFNELSDRDEEVRKEMDFWRNTKVGQFTLDFYAKHR